MKRSACMLLLVAWTGAGCWTLPRTPPAAQPKPSTPVSTAPKPKTTVVADQVTETNARRQAESLREELDREAYGEAK